MIDPSNITTNTATLDELEELILFWVCAAGKNGRTAARCLDTLLDSIHKEGCSPFDCIRACNKPLPQLLKMCGIGCYNSKAKSFIQLSESSLNLRTCTADDLESIHGIGMKTARCFIMHSRSTARYAGLDTHILKHLRTKGVENVPKSTPSSKREYKRLEKEVLKLADKAGMSPSQYDLMIWNKYSVKSTPRVR